MNGQFPILSVNANQVQGSHDPEITAENVVEAVPDDEPEENELLEIGFGC